MAENNALSVRNKAFMHAPVVPYFERSFIAMPLMFIKPPQL
jgi:hypothetical protein